MSIIATSIPTAPTNDFLEDKRLSWKAKGLMGYLLSLPDDTDISVELISKSCKDGKSSIKAGLKELIAAGYIEGGII